MNEETTKLRARRVDALRFAEECLAGLAGDIPEITKGALWLIAHEARADIAKIDAGEFAAWRSDDPACPLG